MIWVFEKARQYCPNAKLVLNDYNILNSDNATVAYLALANLLKQRGLIDVLGEQGHFLETTPMAMIKANLDKFYKTGLPVHISEYDVNILDDHEQLTKIQEQFPVLYTHPAVQGITFWGYRYGQIWREDAFLISSGGTERPALKWLKETVPGLPGGTSCVVTETEKDNKGLALYTSGSDGKITITMNQQIREIELMDLQGKLLQRFDVDSSKVAVIYSASPGIYLVRITSERNVYVKKVMIRN